MDVLRIVGQQEGSTNYVVGDHIYTFKEDLINDRSKLRCNKYKQGCRGTVTLDKRSDLVVDGTTHTCIPKPLEVKTIIFRTFLKRDVQTAPYPDPRTVYNAHVKSMPDMKELIPFSRVRSRLSTLRKNAKKKAEDEAAAREGAAGAAGDGGNRCTICMNIYIGNPIVNDPCGHGFCEPCSSESLKRSDKCPLCRKKVKKTLRYFAS